MERCSFDGREPERRLQAGAFLHILSTKVGETSARDTTRTPSPMDVMPQRWFDRTFDLGLAPDIFPGTLERLRGTPARLEERLLARPEDVLTEKHEGGWSIQEHAGHLLDLESLWAARVSELLAGVVTLSAADLGNRRTNEAKHNDRPIGTILGDFRAERSALVSQLERLTFEDLRKSSRHPRLGKSMTAVDLSYFVAEHDDHHLAAITRLLGLRARL